MNASSVKSGLCLFALLAVLSRQAIAQTQTGLRAPWRPEISGTVIDADSRLPVRDAMISAPLQLTTDAARITMNWGARTDASGSFHATLSEAIDSSQLTEPVVMHVFAEGYEARQYTLAYSGKESDPIALGEIQLKPQPENGPIELSGSTNHRIRVRVGAKINITLTEIGPLTRFLDPQISSPSLAFLGSGQAPGIPVPGGPTLLYRFKAVSSGEADVSFCLAPPLNPDGSAAPAATTPGRCPAVLDTFDVR